MATFDIVIIGSGPAGYVCAIRAAQLGLSVAVVEKRPTFGGTCLNVGCIPSKALLHASEMFSEANHKFGAMGIAASGIGLDLKRMMAFKQEAIDGNTKGVAFLFKKNKITALEGAGRIVKAGEVEVTAGDGSRQSVAARTIVIATGSDVAPLKGIAIDEKRIVSSTGALALETVPKRLVVVGAGVIGLELGSVWRRLGSEVTVVEYLDRILPGMDTGMCKQFQRILAKQGLAFHLASKVVRAEPVKSGLRVSVEPAQGGAGQDVEADVVLIATGRIPYTDGLGLKEAQIGVDEKGRIKVDDRFQTNVAGIHAIGDVIRGPMLAHKGEDEGVALAELIAGQAGHVNYGVIPSVIYTTPEFAAVGKTEEELKADGIAYRAGTFSFMANGRAKANQTTDGAVKILADQATDRVLGVHIIGPMAGELIHECAVLMEFGGSSEDLARTCHAHPTFSEAVKEAAMAVEGRSIHS
ncbi:MAG TPA: dihydrolipoyl dehydrogenase [Aestuariivirgaceae bacterium]|nr:dihydrolipoyl dehydrogenase [Aestuariivirgaceae bacterium]